MPKRKRHNSGSGPNASQQTADRNDESPASTNATSGGSSTESYRSKCEASMQSLRNNAFFPTLGISDDDIGFLKQLQSVYKVELSHWATAGYGYRIMIIWDYNRLWGHFNFGHYSGIFLIDPGPAKFSEETVEFPFQWRGTYTKMPNMIYNSPLTTGVLKIDMIDRDISGHFACMRAASKDYYEFSGKKVMGPNVVPRSLQSFIDEWNEYAVFESEEKIRLGLSSDCEQESSGEESDSESVSETESQFEWTVQDQDDFLRSVTGIFNISCKTIEEEWPSRARNLTMRFHIDRDNGKVWGMFDLGVWDGFLLFMSTPNNIQHDVPLKFRWRSRDVDTGSNNEGEGEVTIDDRHAIQGVFRGMYGDDIEFKGHRKFMPGNVSGYQPSYYQMQWQEYQHGINPWR
ncbi:hypothetical protein AJ80_00826 [Polytolypa hystricis UAMH7299]|uniref:Uncharacterized protein n=1 Tax=Polytolypa hystricis (strain UAMH7299) TaxID=1447883 RepID=A0A2B7YU55_POLH7|nr:hypothetical protein AJ80_00826 [Polytolypa hystricis UAMH7299]